MEIRLWDRGQPGFVVVMVNDRQVGYWYGDGRLHFAPDYQPPEVVEAVTRWLEDTTGVKVWQTLIPPQEPPEWAEQDGEHQLEDCDTDVE